MTAANVDDLQRKIKALEQDLESTTKGLEGALRLKEIELRRMEYDKFRWQWEYASARMKEAKRKLDIAEAASLGKRDG